MKAVIFFFLCTLFTLPTVFGQIKIGDNPQNIDDASVLELESSSKVLVITRVTTAQMETITPQRGGMVYNTDTACIHYFDGTQWINLCDAVSFTITNDPIINNRSTIEITQSEGGYNLEVAKNSILGDNIVDGGIGPDDIQDNSIGQEKLAAESVGSSELRENSVGSEELRDGTIVPTDIANTDPGRVLTTDENGIVQWEDANEIYELTFNKIDTTLSIFRSTTPGANSVNLAGLIGSDDQILTLTPELMLQIEDGNAIDLSVLNNSGTDEQTLATTTAPGNISISNGNAITLNVNDADADLTNEIQNIEEVLTEGNNAGGNLIKNLGNPIDNQDAVTKAYVDGAITGVGGTIVSTQPNNDVSNNGGAFYDDPDDDASNELQDLAFNPITSILTVTNPGTPDNEADLTSLIQNFQNSATVNISGDGTVTNPYVFDAPGNIANGDETIINEGANITVTGNGTTASPYVIAAADAVGDGSETQLDEGTNIMITGIGTDAEPYIINAADDQNAAEVIYDNTTSGLAAATTQAAIDELAALPAGSDSQNLTNVLTQGNNAGSNVIIGLGISLDPTSAATRGYVDANLGGTQDLEAVLGNGTSAGNNQIKDLLDPTLPQDAATQNYVETRIATIQGAGGADGVVQNISASGTGIDVLGFNGGFNGSVDLEPIIDTAVSNNGFITVDSDNQNAGEVPVAATPANYTAGTPDVEAHLAGIDAALFGAGGDPTDEIQDLDLTTDILTITNNAAATPIDLTPYLDNTDAQTAVAVPVAATPTNYTAGTPDVEAHLAGIDAALLGAGGDPTDEIQDLDLTTDILTITNNAAATPIDLTPYLDNTDAQTAVAVPVAAAPTNYTAGTPDVEAHLAGIDAALAVGITDTDDQNVDEFQIDGANILSISLTDDGAAPSTVNLTPYLDNTDAQTAVAVPVAAAPTNYTAGTPDVEAHLAGIDAALAAGGVNPTDEIQDLDLTTDILTITNNAAATPIDLTPYLDNTDAQTAGLVPVTATPTNYSVATSDVEAHLAGIDVSLAAGGGNPTDEIQDLDLTTDILTITNNAAATPIDLAPYLDNTDAQTAGFVPVAATPANYTVETPDVEAHLAGIDAALASGGTGITGTTGSIFFADGAGIPNENNAQLFWDQTLNRLGVGTISPERKLDVNGEIRGNQFSSTGGTANEPAYSFSTGDDSNTGMFRPAADEIGFTVGGEEALRIEEDGGNTNVTILESLQLNNILLDKDGDSGTAGQILSSTGGQTDWIDASFAGVINSDATLTGNGQGIPLSIADNSINSARILDASVTAGDLADNSVDTQEIVNQAVTEAKIQPGADGEVLTTVAGNTSWAAPTAGIVNSDATLTGNGQGVPLSIADNSINSARIIDASVTAGDLADNSVDTAELVNDGVTAAKIASDVAGTGLSQNVTTGALEVSNPVVLAANVPAGTLTINNSAVTPTSVIQLTVRESNPANLYLIQLVNQSLGSFTVRIFEIAGSGNTKTEFNAAWSYVVINP